MSRYSSEAINTISAMQMNNIAVANLTKKMISKVPKKEGSRNGCPMIPRTRMWVNTIHRELGPHILLSHIQDDLDRFQTSVWFAMT